MIPRRWRSLRCVAGFVVILFVLGCMVAIANITQVVDFEGRLSAFEPFEGKEPKPALKRKGKFLEDAFVLRTEIPNVREPEKVDIEIPNVREPVKVDIENKVTNMIIPQQEKEVKIVRENLKNVTNHKLGLQRKGGKKPKAKKVVKLSYLNEDLLKDTREWHEIPPNYNLHAFYYPWYGNPDNDKLYLHWNHEYLPHWNKKMGRKWPTGVHQPPDDVGSNFYPQLGCYSSSDDVIITEHMKQLRFASIGK